MNARTFGEGWDSEVFLVNDRVLFTFPKRKEVLEPFVRGLELLPILAAELPVRVPEIQFIGRATAEFPYPFAGYPLIFGVPALEMTPPRSTWPRLASELGRMLTRLHSLRPQDMPQGLPDHGDSLEQEAFPEHLADALRRALKEDRIEPFLACEAEPPASYEGPRVVTHGDLFDYHVILTPDGDEIAGIIDWFDAGTWDPMADFVGFYLWLGPEFTELVISGYDGPVDDGFRERIRFKAKLTALWEYGSFLDPTSPGNPAAARRYVAHAFSGP